MSEVTRSVATALDEAIGEAIRGLSDKDDNLQEALTTAVDAVVDGQEDRVAVIKARSKSLFRLAETGSFPMGEFLEVLDVFRLSLTLGLPDGVSIHETAELVTPLTYGVSSTSNLWDGSEEAIRWCNLFLAAGYMLTRERKR